MAKIKPSEQAKKLNLRYLGFGRWGDAEGKQVAKTVNGNLVRFEGKGSYKPKPKSVRVIIVNKETLTTKNSFILELVQTSLSYGAHIVILATSDIVRNIAELFKQFAKKITIIPMKEENDEIKKNAVIRKIKDDFKQIDYYDHNPNSIKQIEQLQSSDEIQAKSCKIITHLI